MADLRVLQLSRYDRLGGSSRLRFYDFHPHLAEQGIRVTALPFFDDPYLQRLYARKPSAPLQIARYYHGRLRTLLTVAKSHDLIWLEKEALPWLPHIMELPLLRRIPYVIDFDDAWFHRYDRHRNPVVRTLLSSKFPALVRGAAAVIAGSPYLAEWAEARGARKVVRLPTTVDLGRYTVKERSDQGSFVIGWMGSPSSAHYLTAVAPVLSAMTGDRTIVRLIGSGRVEIGNVEILPWMEATETSDLTGFDVGIMPLTSDEWSEGKCAYKLIQYMAAGLPVVASPVGMNREVVKHGVNGFLADTHQEWSDALMALRNDPTLRARMGANGRNLAEQSYSLAGNAPLLAQTLRDAANRNGMTQG